MEFLTLNNGIKMPLVGFGTVGITGKDGERAVCCAVESGYTLIDTAKMYGNEETVGNAVKSCGVPRENLFITTKLNEPYNSYEDAVRGIEDSFKKLQTDYIDLFLIHEPYSNSLKMYKALCEFYKDGRINAVGISNFNKRCYDIFISECGIIPAVNQIESHVFYQQIEFKDYLESKGTKTQAWAPFASGRADIGGNEILKSVAEKYGKTPHQIALKFLIANGISVIPKSSSAERIKKNIELFDFELSADEIGKIRTLDKNRSLYDWTDGWK